MDFSTNPAPNPSPETDYVLSVRQVQAEPQPDGTYKIAISTNRGIINGALHAAENNPGAIIWGCRYNDFGGGPADGIYKEIAEELTPKGISSLRLFYRMPGAEPGPFEECVLDVLGGVSFLRALGVKAIGVVGHSFSGAVVIKAATLSPHISAVVALSSQLYGAKQVDQLAPRPILLAHGMDDTVLEYRSSQLLYEHAGEPKELVMFEGAGHGLQECRQPLMEKLTEWLESYLGPTAIARRN